MTARFGRRRIAAGALALTSVVGAALGAPHALSASRRVDVGVAQYGLRDCPAGDVVGVVYAGDRAFVAGTDDSGAWLAIRDPRDVSSLRWLPATAVVPDDPALAARTELPVLPCRPPIELAAATSSTTTVPPATTTTTIPAAAPPTTGPPPPPPTTAPPTSPTPPPTTAPTTTSPPAPPPTTAPPTSPTPPPTTAPPAPPQIVQLAGGPSPIYDTSQGCDPTVSTLTVMAAGPVTEVIATYGQSLPGSPRPLTPQGGGLWTAAFGPFSGLPATYSQDVTITVTARDANGNTATGQIVVRVEGTCLI